MIRAYIDRQTGAALVTAAVAGLVGVAGSYAVAGFTPAFVAAPVEGFLSRTMPGAVVTFAILTLGDLGQRVNLAVALALAAGLLATLALAAVLVGRRLGSKTASVGLAVGLCWAAVALLTSAPLAALGAAVPAGVAVALGGLSVARGDADGGVVGQRRRIVAGAAGVLGFGSLAYVVGSARSPTGAEANPAVEAETNRTAETDRLLAEAAEKSLAIEGLDPLVSDEFYQVDINAVNPSVNADDWSLAVTGAVERELSFDYDAIRAMPSEDRFVTLRCVGESLNGKKMDTALWTGVPMTALFEGVGFPDECCVMLRAADGFYEEFPLAALEDGLLAYGMNGGPLPRQHGYPVRALIPGHWGEINVKWLTEIEILEEEATGYWEKRGWHGTGPVNTVAKLHAINRLDDGRVQVGGHAYAGTRGVDRVELSTDGGSSWRTATLSEPLPGDDVWRQWSYEFRPTEPTTVVVRAVDGQGNVQPEERSNAFPSGPTGWVSRTVRS